MFTKEKCFIKLHRIRRYGFTADFIKNNDNLNDKLLELETNDIGNARRVLLYCGPYLVFDREEKRLALWNGKFWDYNAEEAINNLIVAAMDKYLEAALKSHKTKFISHAIRSNNVKEIRAAKEAIAMINTVKDIISEPYYLNTQNGVVDLRTKKLYPHSPDFRCREICNAEYNPDAKSSRFKGFLSEVFEDNHELIQYVKRVCGYGITGEKKEEKIYFMIGYGGNGKSKFIDAISYVLGNYAATIPISALTKDYRNAGSPTPELVPLIGKRIAFANEIKGDAQLNDSMVKQLTGDKAIPIRRMRREFASVETTFKIFVDSNFMPYFKHYDNAIERRVVIIPYNKIFSDEQRDNDLAKKLEKDAEYILKWLVDGAYKYYKEGKLSEPDCIRQATYDFKEFSDSVGCFIKDRTEKCPGSKISSSELYQIYQEYCTQKDYDALGSKAFSQSMQKNRIRKEKGRSANYFVGVRVI